MKRSIFARLLLLTVCAAMLLMLLPGCGSVKTPAPVGTDGEREPLTILTGGQNYAEFAELLNETYPEVRLEFISYSGGDTSSYMGESLAKGRIPDIYAVSYIPDTADQKASLLDLSAYGFVNEYATPMLDSLSVDGSIYLLPSRYALLGMVCNKTVLEENGWEIPTSFEELTRLAPEIEAAGYGVVDMKSSLTGTTFGAFFALGNCVFFATPEGAMWKEDFLAGNATALGVLEPVTDYFQKWIDAGFVTTRFYDNRKIHADTAFDNREYVFQLYSNRLIGNNSTDEYGFMPFLSEDGTNNMLVRLVSRYYGLSKALAEAGNEQKLEDALKVMTLMSTTEGQNALSGGSLSFIPSTSVNDLPEGSPYASVLDLINRGNMVDMVYSGWEDHIVPLIENYGNDWINGRTTAADFLRGMDEVNASLLAGESAEVYTVAEEDIPIEDAARLCAIAQAKAVNADAALISLPAFHGFGLENKEGVHSRIFAGDVSAVSVRCFAPDGGNILTVSLTGAQIKALAEAGYTADGDERPFEYCLVTRDGIELEDNTRYILAVSTEELSDAELSAAAVDTGLSQRAALTDYLKGLPALNTATIAW